MHSYWIKLYTEILHDPKMGRLTDKQFRLFIYSLLIAGENGKGGELPCVEDMAWTLRISADDLNAELQRLVEFGLVTTGPSGEASELTHSGYTVTNFAKRQGPSPVTERVREHRKRKESVTFRYKPCNDENYQNQNQNQIQNQNHHAEKVDEAQALAGGGDAGGVNVFTEYQNNIGLITPVIADRLKDAERDYSGQWIKRAIEIAVERNARRWNYIDAILKRWAVDGYDGDKHNGAIIAARQAAEVY